MTTTMMSRMLCLSKLNGQFHGKNSIFWLFRKTKTVVSHCRYLSENVIHSCGMTAYASVIIAKTPTAPAMHSDHVAGRSGFGRRMRMKMMAIPIRNRTIDQISRPAGRIQGNQSGIKLGIGPVVLREATTTAGAPIGFLSRYLREVLIVVSCRSMGAPGVRRATMPG